MNIYIYGTQNFKKDIHTELTRSNIDYKLGDNGLIQDVSSVNTLKELISDNPEDIFLIDDAKIIKENILNSKIKFLKPKDGIEEKYLKEMRIDDISVDSIHDISKYILKKMKALGIEEQKENEDFEERSEIESSISDIVKDAYDLENDSLNSIDDENSYELSDDLKTLLASSNEEKVEDDKLDDEEPINIKENAMENLKNIEEFNSLDDLSESDILSAFSGEGLKQKLVNNEAKEVTLKLDNQEDIKDFLSKLLNSKALEITVKVKE